MKKLMGLALLVPPLLLSQPAPAQAGASTDAALALGAFAVLNQLVRGETVLHDIFGRRAVVERPVVVHQPPVVVHRPPVVVHQAPTVIYVPAPPPRVVYAPAPVHRFVPPGHAKRHAHPYGARVAPYGYRR